MRGCEGVSGELSSLGIKWPNAQSHGTGTNSSRPPPERPTVSPSPSKSPIAVRLT